MAGGRKLIMIAVGVARGRAVGELCLQLVRCKGGSYGHPWAKYRVTATLGTITFKAARSIIASIRIANVAVPRACVVARGIFAVAATAGTKFRATAALGTITFNAARSIIASIRIANNM